MQEGGIKPPYHHRKIEESGELEGVADAEEFVGFAGEDAGVGG